MAETTEISWAHSTFNPWIGCTKVSPGCDHCYAELLDRNRFSYTIARVDGPIGGHPERQRVIHWGPGAPRHRTSAANWRLPLKWNAKARESGKPWRVFCASLADVFDNEVDPAWRSDLFALIRDTPHLTWMLLTKRIGNAEAMLPGGWYGGEAGGVAPFFAGPLPNVWLGATVVNQAEADRDIPKLLRVPATKRWLSCEPLLGPLDLSRYMWPTHWHWAANFRTPEEARAAGAYAEQKPQALVAAGCRFIDWVIVGGESGPRARAMDPAWARSLRDQCAAARAPFHFKQWGGARPKDGGYLLDGREHRAFPEVA